MNNILKIFKTDLIGLFKNFFALVVAGGLCFLPALYAWFNIYSNWDPYGNTGNVQVAVYNADEGWTNDDGKKLNMGADLADELRHKDSIGWVFTSSEDEAVEGVKSGKYYAALVIDSEFTYGMYHGVAENIENPKITYYVNDKKNAVATKITDSAASSVKASVNKQFVKVLTESIFTETNSLAEELEGEDAVDNFISKIEGVSESLDSYDKMISDFMEGNDSLSKVAIDASNSVSDGQDMIDGGVESISNGVDSLNSTKSSFNSFNKEVNNSLTSIEASISTIENEISQAKLEDDAQLLKADIKQIKEDATSLSDDVGNLIGALDKINGGDISSNVSGAESALGTIKEWSDTISGGAASESDMTMTDAVVDSFEETLNTYSQTISQIRGMYNNQVVPQVNDLLNSMSDTLKSVESLLTNLSSTAGSMSDIFVGVSDTLDTLNLSLTELQGIIESAKAKVDDLIEKLNGANESEKLEIILNLLSGDPEKLGEFFSEPVQTEAIYIYEISNYGSGVAPFYTTLAIWVGMTILVSLIKVHANKTNLVDPKPYQLYFGRYLMFFVLSQLQTAIIVLGDLFLLKIQCIHPIAFWGAAAMASLAFSLVIYSLTIAFGDIGKALAVVVMVIQIAGSGGTYPIEALPQFFRAVYIFFPFPYAINAMRECIGGMYQNSYSVYLIQLGIFCIAALFIGLVVRVPFIKLNHFIEERMEETKML